MVPWTQLALPLATSTTAGRHPGAGPQSVRSSEAGNVKNTGPECILPGSASSQEVTGNSAAVALLRHLV